MDVLDIFIVFCLGEGKGESEAPRKGAGIGFFLKILGGGISQERGGGRGAWRVSVGNLGGGWAKYFVSGRNSRQGKRKRRGWNHISATIIKNNDREEVSLFCTLVA